MSTSFDENETSSFAASNIELSNLKPTDSDSSAMLEAFADIDQTPVSIKELRTWYLFGALMDTAAFPLALFSPVISQGMTAAVGFTSADHSIPCNSTVTNYSCVVKIGNSYVDTASFFFYGSIVATLLQVVLFVGMGSIADHGPWRKTFMLGFSVIGAVCCLLIPTITRNDEFMYMAILSVIITVCLGCAWVFNYAYLPPLARNHPDFIRLLAPELNTPHDALVTKLDAVTNDISSTSFVWNYSGIIAALVLSGVVATLFKAPPESSLPANYGFQIGLSLGGILWLVGIAFAWKHLRARPGPDFPRGAHIATYSTKKVYSALKKCRKLGNLFLFLLGWFMYSDAFNTLTNVALLYAQSVLGFTTVDILIIAAEVPILALLGTFAFNRLQHYTKWDSKRILLIQSGLYILIPLYGSLGLIPGNPIGFKFKIELFIFAGLHGFLTGASQSSCRALFSSLLPPGSESEFFSLYEITDKGSSWIGPLVAAAIDSTGVSKLWPFVFLLLQFALAFVFFWRVDTDKGVDEGRKFNQRVE